MTAGELPEKLKPAPSLSASRPRGFCSETLSPALLESFKIQYLQFLAYTKTPQYKASLQQLLDQEKVRPTGGCIASAMQGGETAKPFTLHLPATEGPSPPQTGCTPCHVPWSPLRGPARSGGHLWWHSECGRAQPLNGCRLLMASWGPAGPRVCISEPVGERGQAGVRLHAHLPCLRRRRTPACWALHSSCLATARPRRRRSRGFSSRNWMR